MVEPRSGEVCSVGNHNVSLLLLIFISYSSVKQYLTTFFPLVEVLSQTCYKIRVFINICSIVACSMQCVYLSVIFSLNLNKYLNRRHK